MNKPLSKNMTKKKRTSDRKADDEQDKEKSGDDKQADAAQNIQGAADSEPVDGENAQNGPLEIGNDDNDNAEKVAKLFGIKKTVEQHITPPGSAYALDVTGCGCPLLIEKSAPASLWGDSEHQANRQYVNVYQHGSGHVVLLNGLPFYNRDFLKVDNAEYLLRLVQLQTSHLPVWFINSVDMPKWYVVLWQHVPVAMLALGCSLLLWFWALLPRFGPVLPLPSNERRALLDHIDASARWLWLQPRGRHTLLQAMREAVLSKLREHHFTLRTLPLTDMINHLLAHPEKYFSAAHQFSAAQLALALQAPAASHSATFSQQIYILQTLRTAHER